MSRFRTGPTAIIVAALVAVVGLRTRVRADEGLKTINNPGGGQIVYGPLGEVSSLKTAMVYVLRTVHSHFDDRPRIGKFFQAKDGQSVATFFAVTAKNQGGGAISGLAIVSMAEGNGAAGAILYDDAARFNKSEPVMMKTLNEAWHVASARPTAPVAAAAAGAPTSGPAPARPPIVQTAPQQLRRVTAGDHSASIALPPGWRVTAVGGGQLSAEGPNGEMIGLGITYQGIQDPREMRMPSFGGRGGATLVYPRGGNLFPAFVSVSNQVRRNKHLSQGTYKLTKSTPMPGGEIEVLFEVDLHDGKGLRKGSALLGANVIPGVSIWALSVDTSNIPIKLADAESKTLTAILRSYSQNSRVVAQEGNQDLARIHASAQAAQIRANAQSAANDAHNRAFDQHMKDIDSNNSAFEAHMDSIDRSSKSFQNYQLDREVIQDNDRNERATTSNGFGDALVKANPDRFQYVKQEDFIKGVDY